MSVCDGLQDDGRDGTGPRLIEKVGNYFAFLPYDMFGEAMIAARGRGAWFLQRRRSFELL